MAKISIYKSNESDFITNGDMLIDCIYCTVEEELNGKYILELQYPIFGNDKHLLLKEENIIKADGQLFRIHSSISNLGYIEVKARHIFYDLLHNFLEDVRPTDLNGNNALNWILDNTQYPHKFRGVSDVSTINTQYYIRKNPIEAILGSDSLSTRWGGELARDNFTIKLLRARGANKGAQIAYGKNLMGLEVEKDMDSVATRIMPVGNDGLLLPEKYIDSPLIDNYNQPYIKKVEIDIGVEEATDDKEGVTQEEAFDIMRQKVSDLYEFDKVDIPYVNIKADLALLENTEEYKELKHLVKVELGDIVSCTDNPLDIEFEAKVIRVKKDVLSNKNVEVELGQFKKGLSDTIKDILEDVKQEIEIKKSDLEKAVENATNLITNALGGYVVKRNGEILIMDKEDPLLATKIWRWNLNGLAYSSNGINGPYRLAMTMDGAIVADFITTGVLNASLLKTGLIKPQVGDDFINMENGHFKLGGMEQDGNGFRLKIGTKPIGDFVDDKVNGAITHTNNKFAELNTTIDGISGRVTSLDTKVDGNKTTTDSKIGALEITADNISTKVSRVETTANRAEDKADANIEDISLAYTLINQTSDDIMLEVGKKIGEDEVVSSINIQPSWVKIDTKNLDLSGNLNLRGKFANYDSISGKKAVELADSKLDFYDYDGSTRTTPVGTIFSSRSGGGTNRVGLAINAEPDAALSIGYRTGGTYGTHLSFDRANEYPVNVLDNIAIRKDIRVFGSNKAFIGSNSSLFETDAKLIIRGSNGAGVQLGSAGVGAVIDWEPSTSGSYPIALRTNTAVQGNFKVSGTKSAVQKTENYGDRLISAYETAEYFYGDIGSGVINEDGECLIHIDEIMQESINTNINYHVFTQRYNGEIDSIDRQKNYFIIYGEVGTEFSWEIKGKRLGYENNRLEPSTNLENVYFESSSIADGDYEILTEITKDEKDLVNILEEVIEFDLVTQVLLI